MANRGLRGFVNGPSKTQSVIYGVRREAQRHAAL